MNITITTKNGVVYLTGNVSNLDQKKIAEQITLNTRDVIDVNNDLKIAEPNTLAVKANNTKVDVSQSVSDSWINSRIRSSLYFSSDFPGSNVIVSTKSGVVTLDGYARNTSQRNEIASFISDFVGVVQVENNLKARN